MAQKTSINIKPCNIGSSEAHNGRTAEYLANIRNENLHPYRPHGRKRDVGIT